MTSHEIEKAIDTDLRVGSRYFLNTHLVPPQAIEVDYSDSRLILRSGPTESLLKEAERIILPSYKYSHLRPDGSPNLDADYQEICAAYRSKIEAVVANGYVEVDESEVYPLSTQSVKNKLLERRLLRPFWLPEVSANLSPDWLQLSHYGGASYLKNQTYPSCKNCHHPLTHLLQLNLSELPAGFDFPVREGVVKVYYCVDDSGDCELFDPAQDALKPNYFCIYIPAEDLDRIVEYPEYNDYANYGMFQPQQIWGWEHGGEEFPDEEYLSIFMDHLTSEFTEAEKYAYTFLVTPYEGDKLGGWPLSAGFDKIATCHVCSGPMAHIYHLHPRGYIEYSPAAVIGRVFICPKHKEEIFFTYNYF